MMIRVIAAAAIIVLASSVLAMAAGASLKSTMKSWKANANAIAQMLNGNAYDEAAARKALQAFVDDSQAIDARLTGATPANKDIKLRFERLNADAAAAIETLAVREKFKASFANLISNCKSCHDQYAR
jgi:cytochrome c556